MERITDKHLEGLVNRLNRLTGSPLTPYAKMGDRYVAQIGNYHISHAYGGVCLQRMHNDGGGVSIPLSCGHIPKRDLYDRIYAFIRGIETQQETEITS